MTPRVEDTGDEELLRRAGSEAEVFAVFYRRYERLVVGWLVHQTRDAHVAADLAAEVFAAAYVGRDRYRADAGSASAWLIGIAHNKLRLSARRREIETRARTKLSMERVGLGGDAVAALEALSNDADAWLASLPGDQRDAVRARVVDDEDYGALAARLNVSEAVARKRVSRGLAALRQRLEQEGGRP
jgi:RNA polymerase sigma factor (sigma-70 family)